MSSGTCVGIVVSRDGACNAPATTNRSGLAVCQIHANVYDEYERYGGHSMARLRIVEGATYADQRGPT